MSSRGPGSTPTAGDAEARGVLGAVGLLVAAMALVPVMDGIAKHLSGRLPVLQVVWARYFFHLVWLLPVVLWRYRLHTFRPAHPWLQLLRGAFLLGGTILFFSAIRWMPLADALALLFVYPLVVTAASPPLLGERVGPRRWAAVVAGFAGACIIIRPGSAVFGGPALLALGSGFSYAAYIVATRRLSGSAPAMITLTFTALVGLAVMSALMPFVWATPSAGQLGLMLCMGLIAVIGHFMLIMAYERAPASVLAPFGYSEMVMAVVVGWVAFGDFPDGPTWIGIAVILASGVYISLRERRAASADGGPTG